MLERQEVVAFREGRDGFMVVEARGMMNKRLRHMKHLLGCS